MHSENNPQLKKFPELIGAMRESVLKRESVVSDRAISVACAVINLFGSLLLTNNPREIPWYKLFEGYEVKIRSQNYLFLEFPSLKFRVSISPRGFINASFNSDAIPMPVTMDQLIDLYLQSLAEFSDGKS